MKRILVASLAAFFVTVLVTSVTFAKKDNDKSKDKGSAKSKSEKVRELKNYEKPTKEKTNANLHKEKLEQVSTGLKETAKKEKNKEQKREEKAVKQRVGGPEAGEQKRGEKKIRTREEVVEELEEVAQETEETEAETVEAIEKVEKRGGFKKFFVGTDYKNLGHLRSSLVHNRNQIRKLTALSEGVTDEETKAAIEAQLTVLMQERERIKTVVTDNEGGFSLLGWAFRLINGYPKDSIDEQEETDLAEEVAEVLEEEAEEDEDSQAEQTEDEAGEVQNSTTTEGQ